MGVIVKLVDKDPMIINADSIAYAEGGNVLEILNINEELVAVYRNWEYAMVQESEEEYQRSVAELDDEEDEDLEDEDLEDEDLEDEDLEDEEDEDLEGLDEESMEKVLVVGGNGSVSDLGELIAVEHAGIIARLAEDGAPTN